MRSRAAALLVPLLLAAASLAAQDSTADPGPMLAERSRGQATAPITVVEMSDFQCPFCRRFFTETFPTIDREYIATGKVRWIFLNYPIVQLHPNAEPAAEFAMCAARFGKFWPVHDLLYRNQETWAPLREPGEYLLTLADSVGLPRDSLLPCLRTHQMMRRVAGDAGTAQRIGARATPTFLVEGALLSGAYPIDIFRHVLDSIYTVRTAGAPPRSDSAAGSRGR